MKKRYVLMGTVFAIAGCGKKAEEQKQTQPPPPPTAGSGSATAQTDTPPPAPAPDPKLVDRGRYVSNAAGCLTCHIGMGPTGPDLEHPGAGGMEIADPGGTWRAPNITPDKASGIGNWTDDQIMHAVREGVRPDGTQLYAIMPYTNYNRMTDDDAKALVAFLRSIKPVERVVAPNAKDLKFPKIPMPKPANAPDPTGDKIKHGEYLATLMLCSHCHWTPDAKMMPQPDKMFSGGLDLTLPMFGTGKLYSRNITSDKDTGIGKWTEDQIFQTIKTMVKPDGKMINPPMLLLQGGWSQLQDDDLKAVAAFVHQIPAVKNKVPDSTFKFQPPGPPPAAGSGAGSGAPAAGSGAPAAGSGAGSGAPKKADSPKKTG